MTNQYFTLLVKDLGFLIYTTWYGKNGYWARKAFIISGFRLELHN